MSVRRELVVAVSVLLLYLDRKCESLALQSRHRTRRNVISRYGTTIDIPMAGSAQKLSSNKYDALLAWLKTQNNAFVSEKIELKPSTLEGGGYGAFITSAVETDELLFRIPRDVCVTLSDAFADPQFGEQFQKLVEKAGPGGNTVVLAGYIAKERLKSTSREESFEDSKYSSYLATLPWERGVNNQEHILYWTDAEVDALLTGTMCYSEATDLRREVALAIQVLEGIFARPARTFKFPWDNQDSTPPIPLDQLPEAVKAAFVCLLTRAFQDDTTGDDTSDEEKLVPLLDMLQHSEEPNVSHVMLKESNGDVEVRSRRALEAGEELLNQYRSELEESMPYHRVSTSNLKPFLRSMKAVGSSCH